MSASEPTRFEIHLADDPDKFTLLAEQVRELAGGIWAVQADGLDQSWWNLDAGGVTITVHREHFLGVYVFGPASPEGLAVCDRIRSHFLK